MMLVAVASFALHGAAMARAAPIAATAPAQAALTDHATHDDGGPHLRAAIEPEAAQQGDGAGDAPGHHGSKNHCCGVCCPAAIIQVPSPVCVDRVAARSVPPALSVDGQGIAHEGLRRPPRPADIA